MSNSIDKKIFDVIEDVMKIAWKHGKAGGRWSNTEESDIVFLETDDFKSDTCLEDTYRDIYIDLLNKHDVL